MLDQSASYLITNAALEKTRKARFEREQERSFLKYSAPLQSRDQYSCPFSVQLLRFYIQEKPAKSRISTQFIFQVETCNQITGTTYIVSREYGEFKRLRHTLLSECSDCSNCSHFFNTLKEFKAPTAKTLLGLDSQRYGASQALELSHFLRDLIKIVVNHTQFCKANGQAESILTRFLRLPSTSLRRTLADDSDMLLPFRKTRQDRILLRNSIRSASSSPTKNTAAIRQRGFSDPEQ
uniref:Uncharacterized protein AlNc14C193G8509 n=1 Tax=Albugo laibachii Nc14 TaxID=890382 RepID=F0WQ27_9STRA|nr:conserved hypothetical protein [Albugo laibachii Nc14]|eukprot:CCA23432.1 conserved hypothetical protein [Albugo laibachii Nc14]